MASPVKMSHYVLQTNQIPALRDWYLAVLGGEIVHENNNLCFITYDEEHHRLALLNYGPLEPRSERDVGLNHVAFSFAALGDLLATWERLKERGIAPHWCVNHGPTTSLYYRDPDGNGVELEVENFAVLEDCKTYMRGADFARNPRGIDFDPADLLRRLRAGTPERELLDRARLEQAPVA
jgi:catechol 2,3-dioxygenase-like lactoylglutathione lyase family enzyme